MCVWMYIYIFIENGEFHTKLFEKQDNSGFNIVKMPLHCSDLPIIMLYGKIGEDFLKMYGATSKTEDLSHNCKQLLSRMLKQI